MASTVDTGVIAPPRRRTLAELVARETARTHRRRWVALAVVAALVVAAIATAIAARPRPVPLAARFRTQPVTRGDVVREVRATGHVEAVTTVQVGAETSGRIATVDVDFNDAVTEGQVLARFDRALLEAQLAQTSAALAAARAALEQAKTDRERAARDRGRVERLWSARSVSDVERDNAVTASAVADQRVSAAEAQVAAQQAALSVAKTNLDHAIIHAPIAGVVITRNVDPGQTVASVFQTPVLFTVAADLRKMRVVAAVDEADIGEVKPRQRATFTVNAYPSRVFDGIVTEVRSSPVVIQDVVTYGTVVEVENLDLALKPGMTASVRVVTAAAKDVLRVPSVTLHFTPPGETASGNLALWWIEGDALHRVAVHEGISDGETSAIDGGGVVVGRDVLVELSPEGKKAYGLGH